MKEHIASSFQHIKFRTILIWLDGRKDLLIVGSQYIQSWLPL